MPRGLRLLGLVLCLGTTSVAVSAQAAEVPSGEQPSDDRLRAGTELVAVRDVTLREATISKGSRVRVVKVHDKNGRTVSLDIELKDGYVLREVAFRKVRDNFKQAQ
jgi:hypothetical protein